MSKIEPSRLKSPSISSNTNIDRALWQLALILTEIAQVSTANKENGGNIGSNHPQKENPE
jgi:hypothetical protein